MVHQRLQVNDLVKVKRGMTYKGKKLKTKDIGILLEMFFNNGLSSGKVFWQQSASYSEDIPTEHLERVE